MGQYSGWGIRVGTDYFRASAITRREFPGGFAEDFLSMVFRSTAK